MCFRQILAYLLPVAEMYNEWISGKKPFFFSAQVFHIPHNEAASAGSHQCGWKATSKWRAGATVSTTAKQYKGH